MIIIQQLYVRRMGFTETEFYKLQQIKMRELWDNKEDEEWEKLF